MQLFLQEMDFVYTLVGLSLLKNPTADITHIKTNCATGPPSVNPDSSERTQGEPF